MLMHIALKIAIIFYILLCAIVRFFRPVLIFITGFPVPLCYLRAFSFGSDGSYSDSSSGSVSD